MVKTINSFDEFETAIMSDSVVVVYCFKQSDKLSLMVLSTLDEIDSPGVTVYSVNLEQVPQIREKYSVQTARTTLLFKDGEVAEVVTAKGAKRVREAVDELIQRQQQS